MFIIVKRILCLFLFVSLFFPALGQIAGEESESTQVALKRLEVQLAAFPQEKVYLQTDKPYYMNGEKIFFRVFLLNALNNSEINISRYVYVELINPAGKVAQRLQIHPEGNLFYGALVLPDDLPQGNYHLRAYTRFMENQTETAFYSRSVFIADPNTAKIDTETGFDFVNDKQVIVNLRYKDIVSEKILIPKNVVLQLNDEKKMTVKPDREGWIRVKLNLLPTENKRTLYTEYNGERDLFRQYLPVPYPKDEIELNFYPEGGNMIMGLPVKVAFKALASDGNAVDITGEVFNLNDESVLEFSTFHDGMGCFSMIPLPEEHYYAVCNYKGKSFRFDLPEAKTNTCALQSSWLQERLLIAVNRPDSFPAQKLYLLIHSNGSTAYFAEWDFSKNLIQLNNKNLHSGVYHILLLTENFRALSERLFFVSNDDRMEADVMTSKKDYHKREYVKMDFRLKPTGIDSISGNFSVSVTDDKDVTPDTTNHIRSEMLLVSELRGRVNNPAWYFRNGDKKAEYAADLLMLIQGWNRYDIPEIMQGHFQIPKLDYEMSQSFMGLVKGGLLSKPYKNANVMILAPSTGFFLTTETDEEGRFRFDGFEFPDSTTYLIQALTKKGADRVELYVDEITYPDVTLPACSPEKINTDPEFREYISKADKHYTFENGVRIINLQEVTITGTAKQSPGVSNTYGTIPDYSITEEELEKYPPSTLESLFSELPGVMVLGNEVRISRYMSGGSPLFVVDGMRIDTFDDLKNIIVVSDIAQVDLIKSGSSLTIYGSEAANGVIEIMMKRGKNSQPVQKFNLSTITPLGYQLPVAFYSPKYDTKEAVSNRNPDLRTTIYWKPDVVVDSNGQAFIDFYTADTPSTYSVVVEGVSSDGRLIYYRGKSLINVK
ncbi:MAG: TonB-dependent receptor plug domain-containing protein [Dysgonamonadaceae bacterium]|nr:TonB-dependent receptor plug domain-containing protein [Dysgonamonadaceae bacterium]